MINLQSNSNQNKVTNPLDELRSRVESILGVDRWVWDGKYPAVTPFNSDEVSRLLKGHPGMIMVVGNGSSFPDEFFPGGDVLVLLTSFIKSEFSVSDIDQTLIVSAGWPVEEVNRKLEDAGFIIPSLAGFNYGTIGGRLASVSSHPILNNGDGWIQSLLGLEVVLPGGEVIEFGGQCIKDVAGYDLKHFFTGSHGAIGVITQAIFRCLPKNSFNREIESDRENLPVSEFDPHWRKIFDPFGRMQAGI
ncbi:FAD-binding oxidoreductase [bacterium]|nr:FAD-binding oxidoreductase [bacterium]